MEHGSLRLGDQELADRWILIAKMVGKTAERKKVTRWTEEEHRFFTIIISFLFLVSVVWFLRKNV